jgi:hypothetical protein
MGTNASLSRFPLHPVCCLCCWQQERLQVAAWQPGHLYFGTCVLHTLHVGGSGVQEAATETIFIWICCCLCREQNHGLLPGQKQAHLAAGNMQNIFDASAFLIRTS